MKKRNEEGERRSSDTPMWHTESIMKNNISARIHRIVRLVFCQEMCSILSLCIWRKHTHTHTNTYIYMPFVLSPVCFLAPVLSPPQFSCFRICWRFFFFRFSLNDEYILVSLCIVSPCLILPHLVTLTMPRPSS